MKRALITGITGQDGSYLAELLLGKGYAVRGVDCRPPTAGQPDGVDFVTGDIADGAFVRAQINDARPDEVYNFASQARPDLSGELLEITYRANLLAVVQMLEAIRESGRPTRFLQASTSEIFGNADQSPQDEATPIRPRNPYGISKAAAHLHTAYCRQTHGLFACNGIFYNHESPRRPENYVTRKVTLGAARIKKGLQGTLRVGNLKACRDWGYAPDYVRAVWLMLQADVPDDYVVATGELHSVRELLEIAFGAVDLDWRKHVTVDDQLVRVENGLPLQGNATKARQRLNWQPSITFRQMIERMVEADLKTLGMT